MTDYKNSKNPENQIPSGNRRIHLSNEKQTKLSANLETDKLIQEYSTFSKKFRPHIKPKDPNTFAYYGKAEQYYEDSIYNIVNYYPFDGTLEEVYQWHHDSSHLDSSIIKSCWPSAVGHISLNYSEYIQFYTGPTAIEQITKTGEYNDQETGLKLDAAKGNTVEFWLKKDSFNTGQVAYEVIFDIGPHPAHTDANTSANFTLGLKGAEAKPLRLTYKSGLNGVEDMALGSSTLNAAAIADSKWHHYALKVWQEGTTLYAKLYIDGQVNSLNTANVPNPIASVDRFMGGTIGGLQNAGTGTLAASIDTFRFWKGLRSSREITRFYDQKVYASDLSNKNYTSRLGLQYTFNKANVGTDARDAVVVDTSGNTISGKIYNYSNNNRVSTSAIDLSSATKNTELKDPILLRDHSSVVALAQELKNIAKVYDQKNASLLSNSVPTIFTEKEFNGQDNKEFQRLLHLLASQFDEIKVSLDSIRKVSTLEYSESLHSVHNDQIESNQDSSFKNIDIYQTETSKVDSSFSLENKIDFHKKKLTNLGLEPGEYDLLWTARVEELVESIVDDKRLERGIQETRNLMYSALANAASYINKRKGTESSYDAILNSLGMGREVVSFNVYDQNAEIFLPGSVSKLEPRVVETNSISFADNNTSTIHMTQSSSDASSFIESDSSEVEYTFEGNFVFPSKKIGSEVHTILESSVFGIQQVGASQNDLTTTTPNNASFIVKVVKPSLQSNDAKFVLSSDSNIIADLETEYFRDIYENTNWNLAIRISKSNDNKFLNVPTPAYKVEFLGHSYIVDDLDLSFHKTVAITETQYNNLRNANKTIFIGAHNTNITGANITKSDIKFVNFSAWKCALSDDEIQNSAKTLKYFGSNRPHKYVDLNSTKNIDFHNTALLRIGLDAVTSVDENNIVSIADQTGGSALLKELKGTSAGTKYPFTSSQFSQNISSVVQAEHFSAVENIPISNSSSISGIQSKQFDLDRFDKTENAEVKIISFEKSMSRIVSREMLSFLSGIASYNNLLGEPVNKYRSSYKLLQNLRTKFFLNINNENQFERFVNYYRWIDKAIGHFLNKVVPASVHANTGIENVVESHSLERNKISHRLINIETRNINLSTNLLSINELLYDWKTGHAPLSGDENENCRWQKDRKELSPDRDKIQKVITTISEEVPAAQNFREYALRNLTRPFHHTAQEQSVFVEGFNRHKNNIPNFYKVVNEGKEILINSSTVEKVKKCNDRIVPNEKEKYIAKAQVDGDGGYTDGKVDLFVPFTIYSASVDNTYKNFNHNILLNGVLDSGPYSSEMPHRNVKAFSPAADRPEAYDLEIQPTYIKIKKTAKQQSLVRRDPSTTRHYSTRNIKTNLDKLILGNYKNEYEIVQTNSKLINNSYLVDTEGAWLAEQPSVSIYVNDTIDFKRPLRPRRSHVIKNIFNAPGSTETNQPITRDLESEEYSIYNTLNLRNSNVRNVLHRLSVEHSAKGGYRPVLGLNGLQQGSIHKTYRNPKRSKSTSELVSYDNSYLVNHIPQNDFSYSWITASVANSENVHSFLARNANIGHQHNFEVSGSIKSYETINFLTKSDTASFLPLNLYTTRSISTTQNLLLESTNNLNNLILSRQGPYGWSSWKQLKAEQNPIIKALRKENKYSVSFRSTEPSPSAYPGINFDYFNTVEDIEAKIHARVPRNYKEIMISNRFRPLFYSMHSQEIADLVDLNSEGTQESEEGISQREMKNMWYYDSFLSSIYGSTEAGDRLVDVNRSAENLLGQSVSIKTTVHNDITTYANQDIVNEMEVPEMPYQANENLQNLNYFISNAQELNPFPTILRELNYIEKIYPKETNTYTKNARTRERFSFFGWTDTRSSRNLILSGNIAYGDFLVNNNNLKMFPDITSVTAEEEFKKSFYNTTDIIDLNNTNANIASCTYATSSKWVLDSRQNFSSRPTSITASYFNSGPAFMANRDQASRGEGILQNDYNIFALGINNLHGSPPFAALYNRRIPQTYGSDVFLAGESKWEAADGHPIGPFYESYEKYAEEVRLVGQNYSLVPEFTISKYAERILKDEAAEDITSFMDDFLEVTGAAINQSSGDIDIGGTFFKTYSTSDFLKYFEPLRENIEDNDFSLLPGRITLRCRAAKRFLPYRGFYPAERVVQISEIFNRSYLPDDSYDRAFANGGPANDDATARKYLKLRINNSKAQALKPLMAPGVLMNSIKAGVAVDYPIFLSSVSAALTNIYNATDEGDFDSIQNYSSVGADANLCFTGSLINSTVDSGIPRLTGSVSRRVTFEDLLNPRALFNETIHDNEPHPSASLLYGNVHHFSAMERPVIFGNLNRQDTIRHTSNEFNIDSTMFNDGMRPYKSAINNFTAETVNFFLEGGKLQTLLSEATNPDLDSGFTYKMRVYLQNNKTTMYDRHSAFGPPVDDGDPTFVSYSDSVIGGTSATSATLPFTLASPGSFDLSYITTASDLPTLSITDEDSVTYNYKFYDSASGVSVSDTTTTKHINVNSINNAGDFATSFSSSANDLSIKGTFAAQSGGSVTLTSETAGAAANANVSVATVNSTVTGTAYIADNGGSNTPSILSNDNLSWSTTTGTAASLSIAMNAPATSKILGTEGSFANNPSNYPFLKVTDESSTVHTIIFYDSNSSYMANTSALANTTYINIYNASGSAYKTTSALISDMKTVLEGALDVTVDENSSGVITITLDSVGVPSNATLASGNCFLDNNTSPCSSGNNISTANSLPSFTGGTATTITSVLTFQAASDALNKLKVYGNASNTEGGYGPGIRLQDGDGTTHTFYFYNADLHGSVSNTTSATYIALSATNTVNATNFKSAVDAVSALNITTAISSNVVTLSDTTTGTTPTITELAPAGERTTSVLSGIITNSSLSWTSGADASGTHTTLNASSATSANSHGFLPYVPPFLDPGTSPYAEISYTARRDGEHNIPEIIRGSTITYYNMDQPNNHQVNTNYKEAMNLLASLDLKSHVKLISDNNDFVNNGETISRSPKPGPDKYRWVIQTKWETPVLDFTHNQVSSLNLQTNTVSKVTDSPWKTRYQTNYYETTLKPNTNYLTASTGMWHQAGNLIPHTGPEGYVLSVAGPKEGGLERNLAAILGFQTQQGHLITDPNQNPEIVKKIGKVAKNKEIYEAVVAIPYFNSENEEKINLFPLDDQFYQDAIELNQNRKDSFLNQVRANNDELFIQNEKEKYEKWKNLPGINATENIAYQIRMMNKFIIPPHFDFIRNSNVQKHVQYIFQFKADLKERDLADMWQNLYPGSGTGISVSQHSQVGRLPEEQPKVKHDVEYISNFLDVSSSTIFEGKSSNYKNPDVFISEKVKWLVFKAKFRAISDYETIKKRSIVPFVEDIELYNSIRIPLAEPGLVKFVGIEETATPPEPESTGKYGYNWPYDFFSMVELAEVQSKVDFYEERPNEIPDSPGAIVSGEPMAEPDFAFDDLEDPPPAAPAQGFSANQSMKEEIVNSFVTRNVLKSNEASLPSQPRVYTATEGSIKLGSESIYLNGVLQQSGAGNDYTITGNTITFNFTPNSDDSIIINYIKE